MKYLFVFICLLPTTLFSQNREIEIESSLVGDKVVFTSKTNLGNLGTYSVAIIFNNKENMQVGEYVVTTIPIRSQVLSVPIIDPKKTHKYQYTYFYARGKVNVKHKDSQYYRLPVSEGKTVQVLHSKNLNEEYLEKQKIESWRSFFFAMEKGDTVFAARRGVVVEIHNNANVDYDPNFAVSYNSNANYLLVEHKDGTIANYSVLEKDSFMVKVGQDVFPDTPLALSGTYNNKDYQARLTITYPIFIRKNHKGLPAFDNIFIDPIFITEQGDVKIENGKNYAPKVTPELITSEMNKSEIKKRTQK